MPLITRIAGVRVELHRELRVWTNDDANEKAWVTWVNNTEGYEEIFGLGYNEAMTTHDDAYAITGLMQFFVEEWIVRMINDGELSLTDNGRLARFSIDRRSWGYRKPTVRQIERLLDAIHPDWRGLRK